MDRFRAVHTGALALVAIFLPWSEFLLSNAQILLVGNWLVEGVVRRDLPGRFRRGFGRPTALVFLSFFFLHVVGLAWTEDLSWGLDLSRILLPILVLTPILASTEPLEEREVRAIVLLGAWSTIASTWVCLLLRNEMLGSGGFRELSVFISHIRLALLLCFSGAVFVLMKGRSAVGRWAHALGLLWCLYFLYLLSSLMGIAIMALLGLLALWSWTRGRPVLQRSLIRMGIVILPFISAGLVFRVVRSIPQADPAELRHLDARSAGGEWYYHDLRRPLVENGHFVWINVADGELQRAWERRSRVPYLGDDAKGQKLRHTLMRYLASMGVRKDSIGAVALTDEDVRRIESGVTSVVEGRRDRLRARMEQIIYEWENYRSTGDPTGHSVAMRAEFLRAGIAIAQRNLLTGVGTGDTRPAFAEEYDRRRSVLVPAWRLRAHNEYLTLLISFGIPGLLWSMFSWAWPAWRSGAHRRPLFIAWAVIFLVSCLSEDTIETQMGATFFAFFYTLHVFGQRPTYVEGPAV